MAEVHKVCRITMDTSLEAAMTVHGQDDSHMKFTEYKPGLYYFDTATVTTQPNLTSPSQDYLFLNTVAMNKGAYTRREIEGADRARALYKKIGWPSEQAFVEILQNNLIRNCPVTPDNARRALKIYGPDIATLKGKTVKKQIQAIPNYQAVTIPAPIIAQYDKVRLFIDIFWVNGSPYFHTIDTQYFFIKNRLDLEHIDVKHCPTEQMLANFFTKPLQGSLFRKFRDIIMGHKHMHRLIERDSAGPIPGACWKR
jgi:hypothetical protein